LYSYDNIGFGDVDITSYRLGMEHQKMSRKEIRNLFGQANSRYVPVTSGGMNLKQTLKMRVDEAKVEDPQFIEVEVELARIYEGIISTIEDMRDDGRIEADTKIPSMHAVQASTTLRGKCISWHIAPLFSPVFNVCTALANEHGLQDDLNKLDAHLKHRKTVHKSVRSRLEQDVKTRMVEEQKKSLRINKAQLRRHLPGRGFEPQGLVEGADVRDLGRMTEAATASLDAEQTEILDEEGEDVPLNDEVLDIHQEQKDGRGEPSRWRDLGEDVEIRVDRNDDEEAESSHAQEVDTVQRNMFLLAWANKANSPVPNSNLQCPLCIADDTQPEKAKNTTYSLAKLNIHLDSGTHSRRSQLLRAFNIEAKTMEASKIKCPLCGLRTSGRGSASSKFMAHVEELHPEELWEEDQEVRLSDRSASREEDTSDEGDDLLHILEGHDEQPVISYKGKGKAAVLD
jgi:hypothetical protein